MIKIIYESKSNKLYGCCSKCCCRIECEERDTTELIDRDTTSGMATRYVRCPSCKNEFLWVNKKKDSNAILR